MFVDACAVVSMMAGEATSAAYSAELIAAVDPWTRALVAWEATIVLARADQLNCSFGDSLGAVLSWLDQRKIELREIGAPREILGLAVSVAQSHGVGKRALSSFDCFHYACAKSADQPLLTLDRLLRETDVESRPR